MGCCLFQPGLGAAGGQPEDCGGSEQQVFVGTPCERFRYFFEVRPGFFRNRFCDLPVESGGFDCHKGHVIRSALQELGTSQKVLLCTIQERGLEFAIRFLVGGIVVSVFALLGDLLRPKSFAGLFSAAPSVALVTLGLAFQSQGADYVAAEARAMILGGIALAVYGALVCHLLMSRRWSAAAASCTSLLAWFGVGAGLLMIWGA